MRHYSRAFTIGQVLLAFTLVCATAVIAVTSVASGARPPSLKALPLVSNHSSPAGMDKHFDQHPWATFPASSLGLPDGTCYVYGNKVSWIVFQCFGGQPEVMP